MSGALWAVLARRFPRLFLRLRREPRTSELGLAGEALAARWLRRRGLRVLERRVEVTGCELDLVCVEGSALVSVEVKTSRQTRMPLPVGHPGLLAAGAWRPGRRLSRASFERQRSAARRAARLVGLDPRRARVDLVEVRVGWRGRRIELEHHRGLAGPLQAGDRPASRGY